MKRKLTPADRKEIVAEILTTKTRMYKLAARYGVSDPTISSVFKKVTGNTIKDYKVKRERSLEIKRYRAWHTEEKKMYAVVGLDWFNQQVLIDANGLIAWHPMDLFKLMFYSELPDSKGQKLCEGDIIQFPINLDGKETIVKDVVTFDRESGQFIVVHTDEEPLCLHNDESLLIGNIHENPELENNLDVA